MFKLSQKYKVIAAVFCLTLLTQSCAPVKLDSPTALPTVRDVEPAAGANQPTLIPASTATVKIPTSTKTEIAPTVTSAPKVILNVVKGNIFIRRGPDMAFNPVGVLYKDTSTEALARDVLSKWVQVNIPNSDQTGWVSIQTSYSQIIGEVSALPEYTPTEWPVAAYLRNCTHHRMYVMPGELVISSSLSSPDNEIWIYPGSYTVYDIDVLGDPEVTKVTVGEGSNIEILDDGLGGHRKCE